MLKRRPVTARKPTKPAFRRNKPKRSRAYETRSAASRGRKLAKQKAEAEQARSTSKQKAEAEQARQTARTAARRRAQTQKALQAAAQPKNEKAQLRGNSSSSSIPFCRLATQPAAIIVNMSDVLFVTGSSTLKPGAREKLGQISGILLAHKGLTLQIEGHTDSVGRDDFNQQLSERRSDSVAIFSRKKAWRPAHVPQRGFRQDAARVHPTTPPKAASASPRRTRSQRRRRSGNRSSSGQLGRYTLRLVPAAFQLL